MTRGPPTRPLQLPIQKPAKSPQLPESRVRPGYETPAISAEADAALRTLRLAGFYFGVDMSAWRRRVVRLASIPRAASNSPTLLSRSPGAAGPASRLKARFTKARSAEGGRTLKVSKDRWGRRRDCGLAFGNPRDDRPPRSRIAEDRLIMKTQHAPFQPLSADIDEKIESLAREKGYFAPDRIRAP